MYSTGASVDPNGIPICYYPTYLPQSAPFGTGIVHSPYLHSPTVYYYPAGVAVGPANNIIRYPSGGPLQPHQPQPAAGPSYISGRKQHSGINLRYETKQSFAHPFPMTSFSGHEVPIRGQEMDFCQNDRVAATAEGAECCRNFIDNKENNAFSAHTPPKRQRRNNSCRKEETASPETGLRRKSPKITNITPYSSNFGEPEAKLGQNTSGNLLVELSKFIIDPKDHLSLGFPVEILSSPGHAMVFKPDMKYARTRTAALNRSFNQQPGMSRTHVHGQRSGLDVSVPEFVPKVSNNGTILLDCHQSPECVRLPSSVTEPPSPAPEERKCVRCGREYLVAKGGRYITNEECWFHWGKLRRQADSRKFECCGGEGTSKGCTSAEVHVWNGLRIGCMNTLEGFVKTLPRETPLPEGVCSVFAIDAEMCYTTEGFELIRITVVNAELEPVYDSFVMPENKVVDYNTRFSGITAKDILGGSKNLREVQTDLLSFIRSDTILIGHGIENDLLALKMIHLAVIDTALVFPHYLGLPYKRSLKSIVSIILKQEIQEGANGHDSFEDARSCMALIMWRLRSDGRI